MNDPQLFEQLRRAVAEVTTRLPAGVRLVLDEMQVVWRVNDNPAGSAHVGIEQLPTGRFQYVLELKTELFSLPMAIIRRVISHELAHLYLHHPDHQEAWKRAGNSEAEFKRLREIQEDEADFLAAVIWGFAPDYAESAKPWTGADGALYRRDCQLPIWFDQLADRLKRLS